MGGIKGLARNFKWSFKIYKDSKTTNIVLTNLFTNTRLNLSQGINILIYLILDL
jgi:hypothetical protein